MTAPPIPFKAKQAFMLSTSPAYAQVKLPPENFEAKWSKSLFFFEGRVWESTEFFLLVCLVLWKGWWWYSFLPPCFEGSKLIDRAHRERLALDSFSIECNKLLAKEKDATSVSSQSAQAPLPPALTPSSASAPAAAAVAAAIAQKPSAPIPTASSVPSK